VSFVRRRGGFRTSHPGASASPWPLGLGWFFVPPGLYPEVGGLFFQAFRAVGVLVLPVLESVEGFGVFSFIFQLFLVASRDFQVMAREER